VDRGGSVRVVKYIARLFRVPIRQAIIGFALVIFSFAATEVMTRFGWLDVMEYTYYDLWHILLGQRAEPKHVVIVAVDNQTLLQHQNEPLVFWGPHFARVIENTRKAGARIIGVDYLFTISSESWLKNLELPGTDRSRTYDIPMRTQLASGQVVLIATLAENDQGNYQFLLPISDYLFSLPGARWMWGWLIFIRIKMGWSAGFPQYFLMTGRFQILPSRPC